MLVALIAQYLVGGLLTVSSVSKAFNFRWFVQVLAAYRLVSPRFVEGIALGVILGELVLGTLLLSGVSARTGGYGAFVLFGLFSTALVINLARGHITGGCGCFGFGKNTRLHWSMFTRNLGLAGLAICAAGAVDTALLFVTSIVFVVLSMGVPMAARAGSL